MNLMNGIMGLMIADSRAKYYKVSNPQGIKTVGLLMGMTVKNPLMSFLLIESMAKNPDSAMDIISGLTHAIKKEIEPRLISIEGKIEKLPKDIKKEIDPRIKSIEGKIHNLPRVIKEEFNDPKSPLAKAIEEIKNLVEALRDSQKKEIFNLTTHINETLKETKEGIDLIKPKFLKSKNPKVLKAIDKFGGSLSKISNSALLINEINFSDILKKALEIKSSPNFSNLEKDNQDFINSLLGFKKTVFKELTEMLKDDTISVYEIEEFYIPQILCLQAISKIESSLIDIKLKEKPPNGSPAKNNN